VFAGTRSRSVPDASGAVPTISTSGNVSSLLTCACAEFSHPNNKAAASSGTRLLIQSPSGPSFHQSGHIRADQARVQGRLSSYVAPITPKSLDLHRGVRSLVLAPLPFGGSIMAWKKPTVTEIALGAEINSYACADLKR
jgi:coenzyme PQQ precursor peptide PqqA